MSTLTTLVGGEHCSLILILAIVFGALISVLVPSVFLFETFGWYLSPRSWTFYVCCLGAIGLLPLISVVVPAFIIVITLFTIKSLTFAHINLKITRDNYSLTQKGITWISFFQIVCLRSHYNDLQSRQFVETTPKESHYVRDGTLRAEVRSLILVYS